VIDPQELPLEEVSLGPKGKALASPSWRELTVYMTETHRGFHTIQDYRATLRFFILRYSKAREILVDWSNN